MILAIIVVRVMVLASGFRIAQEYERGVVFRLGRTAPPRDPGPESMQRAMAREAEAVREKRARLIKAEAEREASEKLAGAAELIMAHPAALELRRMQMVSEIGAENNSRTILLLPSEMVTLAGDSRGSSRRGRGRTRRPPPHRGSAKQEAPPRGARRGRGRGVRTQEGQSVFEDTYRTIAGEAL